MGENENKSSLVICRRHPKPSEQESAISGREKDGGLMAIDRQPEQIKNRRAENKACRTNSNSNKLS